MQLAVIIPAFDESESLGWVLGRMPKALAGIDRIHVFVVDDGSGDQTGVIAAEHGATVLRHSHRMGLASAFRTGLHAALHSGSEFIATVDADGQYDPQELGLLLDRMQRTKVDLVVGDRQIPTLHHMPIGNRIGNVIGSLMLRLVGATSVTDASSGFRLFTRHLGLLLDIRSPHTYTHEMLIQATAYRCDTADVPVTFLSRRYGPSKLVRSLRHHILRSCGTILKSLFLMRTRTVLLVTRHSLDGCGGIQTYVRSLIRALSASSEGCRYRVIAHRGGIIFLPVFFCRALFASLTFRGRQIHFLDASLCPFLPMLSIARPGIARSITVYGLDLTWRPVWYQWILRRCLPFAHRVVAISQATAAEAMKRGAKEVQVIPCGIRARSVKREALSDKPQILLLGRQIERKGTVWFLREVLPIVLKTHPDLRVVIAGDGPMLQEIRSTVDRLGLDSVVSVLGAISDEQKSELYRSSSFFVMPNIPVAGDMEGFGIVCIEAVSWGLPVVASRLEGIVDAVIDQKTGVFFEPLNKEDAAKKMSEALVRRWDLDKISEICLRHFGIEKVARRYVVEVF